MVPETFCKRAELQVNAENLRLLKKKFCVLPRVNQIRQKQPHSFSLLLSLPISKMKKKKIASNEDFFQDFLVLNISAAVEDYHLAYLLNNNLSIWLVKTDDLTVVEDAQTILKFSAYYFSTDYRTEFFLLKNTSQSSMLITGYYFIVNGFQDDKMKREMIAQIENIEKILQLDELVLPKADKTGKTKKKEVFLRNLINELEFHSMEIKKKQDEQKVKLKTDRALRPRKLY
jgi:hypothetical protein